MRQIVDMAPAAPDLPAVPERRGIAHPALALAGGFAAVVLFVGVGAALLVQPDAPSEAGRVLTPGVVSLPAIGDEDANIVVVFFDAGPTDPPVAAVDSLRARAEVEEVLVVDTAAAEAEIRAGLPLGEPMWSDGPGLNPTVRLRVANDEAVETVAEFASELEGVIHIDAYFGAIELYPPWSFQGSTTIEESVATTTTIVGPIELGAEPRTLLTPQEHAARLTRCLLDAEMAVRQDAETGAITFDNRVVDVAEFESAVEGCDRMLVEQGYDLPGESFIAPVP